ncbi:MAG: hypothetical protein AAF598_22030, partial [Bacteroidota bacterium]
SQVLFHIPVLSEQAGAIVIERSMNGIFFQAQDTLLFEAPNEGKETFFYQDHNILKFRQQMVYYRVHAKGYPEKAKEIEIPLNAWEDYDVLKADPIRDMIEINYEVDQLMDAQLRVYDGRGQLIVDQTYRNQKPGEYSRYIDIVYWPTGDYLVLLRAGNMTFPGRIKVP